MKITLVVFLSVHLSSFAFGQQNENIRLNNDQQPCISLNEYRLLEEEVSENIRLLGLPGSSQRTSLTTTLDWPIRAAVGFTDCDYYFIGAYVDQNTSAGVVQDFNCGTNTYDGHHGTDIAIWPYGFYKMDHSYVEVIAAAPGTIVQKADGNFDRNCTGNSLTANSIIIQHADGSQALYWHMKNGSVTSKSVGQTVVAGEYLGAAGSSGSSSGPHLHFEVWTGNVNTSYQDPFSGACNLLNANTWWNVQRPHTNPAVIKVSVNTTDLVLPGCPTTETPNESDTFIIPFQGTGLPAGFAKFYVFIRDDVSGMTADIKILNPNGSTFNSWTYTSAANTKTVIKGYSKLLPTIAGTYTFQATYNGLTCSKTFTVQNSVSTKDIVDGSTIQLYPNPSNGKIFLSLENLNLNDKAISFNLYNSVGQVVKQLKIESDLKQIELNLPAGIYIYKITSEKEETIYSAKLIIE